MRSVTQVAIARGAAPADLLLKNTRLVNVFSGEIEKTDIAIANGLIVGVGRGYQAASMVDLGGMYVTPGLIDAHVHIESSLCTPLQFARTVVPHGVTTIVADPHEIANVAGIDGLRYMVAAAKGLPMTAYFMAPSCVPATHMESNGATLDAADLQLLLAEGTVHGLAEVMNFPGVIQGDDAIFAKLSAFAGHPIDGHAPALRNQALNAYVAAGIGSEHECTTVEEAAEKLARGLYIFIREATNARNLHPLLPLITPYNSRRICFCTDDRIPSDLLDQGTIDYMVREAIAFGIDPMTAIRMATLNPAEWFNLHDRGAIAPGRVADLVVVEDLHQFQPYAVYAAGQLVAKDGKMNAAAWPTAHVGSPAVTGSVKIDWSAVDFRIAAQSERIHVIGSREDQLVTEDRIVDAHIVDGYAEADLDRDLLKMAVIERHHGSGAIGRGFIQGFGLQRGAIAGTVAHDHHNLVVIGADDHSMMVAARTVAAMGGGLVIVDGDAIVAQLPLPVAGLMSEQPVEVVRQAYDALIAAAHAQGSELHDPFMAMSFMALEVIPSLKLTDQGLVDVDAFELVDLFV